MKIEFPLTSFEEIKEAWPGQFNVFTPYYSIVNIPTPVFLVTTLKENGLSNVQLNAWGMIAGSGKEPKFMLQVMNSSDTYRLINKNREFVINIPAYELKDKFMEAIKHFSKDKDEIIESGFTSEFSKTVAVPRIKECFAHIECKCDWIRDIESENKVNSLVVGSIAHVSIEEECIKDNINQMLRKYPLAFFAPEFYNHTIRGTVGGGSIIKLDIDSLIDA